MSIKALIKLAISAAMLFIVLRTVDLESLTSTILKISPQVALIVVVSYLFGQLLSSVKWWMIARAGGIDVPYSAALKSYFIGTFVNCFGFGMVGGDAARGLLLAYGKPQKTPALASVVADRLHGLAILALIGGISALIFDRQTMDPSLYGFIGVLVAAIVIGWFLGPIILLKIIHPTSRYRRKAVQLAEVFPRRMSILIPISILSVLFHLMQIALHYVMAHGVGAEISWPILLTVVPVVNILCSIPISWNGLGVREKGYIHFLTPAILSTEQAVAFGAIWLLAVTVTSAIGGIVALLTRDFEFVSKIEKSEDYKVLEKQLEQTP